MTTTQVLTAAITRPVTFHYTERLNGRIIGTTQVRTYPTGTEVYVTEGAVRRDGTMRARVCGTLFEQFVSLADLDPDC